MPKNILPQVLHQGQRVTLTGHYTTTDGRKVAYIVTEAGKHTAVYADELTISYPVPPDECDCNGVNRRDCPVCNPRAYGVEVDLPAGFGGREWFAEIPEIEF